ncbi:MAG TPA: phosphate ABC transporter permease subunit PstC [Anaerohalosphaeraceae bacterium]|nr:phosphate ABC transporter permease subunit PstC [Anaerohalosphaeraceae bacterium]HOL87939.1 phosphate ABC transporter permease subunit PstC [Anaerohalosphaeraceae bacterium]HPP55438.1 phosphate ABC transporter permease subunit PstC [Anaerohalosphaeraceae bacterium]
MTTAGSQSDAAVQFTRPLRLTFRDDLSSTLLSWLVKSFLFVVTFCSVAAVLLIFVFVIRQAAPFFAESRVSPLERLTEFFTSRRWFPEHQAHPEYGILAIIAGSFYVTITSLLIAVPTGLLAAVFLSDIASFRTRQICKPLIEILAAIPSVAYGVFAVMVVAPWLQKNIGFPTGTNALNASLILSVMAMPTIISVAEDALSAVGREIREASYALGATRAETMLRIVIPAAHSGILAAVILGMMRAVGETMVVWMASGNATQIPSPWWDLSQSVRTMTATIAGELGEVPQGTTHFHSLFAIGLVLLIFTFCLNLLSEHFIMQMKKPKR